MVLSNKEWLAKMDDIISAIQNGGGDSQVIEDMLSNMWISSATYNVGDYVLYNNNIWKCLIQNSNIAPTEGDTWTSVTITNEISTLNSNLTTKVDKSVNGVVIFKNGKNIELRVNTTKELTANSWTTILIIPQDYTPNAEGVVRTVCWNNTSDIALQIIVRYDGYVNVYSKTGGNINICADISYIQ